MLFLASKNRLFEKKLTGDIDGRKKLWTCEKVEWWSLSAMQSSLKSVRWVEESRFFYGVIFTVLHCNWFITREQAGQ